MKETTAGELRLGDILEYHGRVTWTIRAPSPIEDNVIVHIVPKQGKEYSLLLPITETVRYTKDVS